MDKMTRALPENISKTKIHMGFDKQNLENVYKEKHELNQLPYAYAFLTAYQEFYNTPHPHVSWDKLEEYNREMEAFRTDTSDCIYPEDILYMAEEFFLGTQSTTHNIDHFACWGVLNTNFYQAHLR